MIIITEDYVSFEIAKLLKEKGFNEGCNSYFISDNEIALIPYRRDFNNHGVYLSAPTLQMAMKWLREVHNTFISIIYENDGVFVANLKSPLKGVNCMIDDKHNCWFTYEEACEASIKYCLENLI